MAMDNGAELNFFWVVLFEDRPYFIIPDIWMWPEKQMCLLRNTEQQAKIFAAAQTKTPPGKNWISRNIIKTFGPCETYDQAMRVCEKLETNSNPNTEDEREFHIREHKP